jgi:hypothetical protein
MERAGRPEREPLSKSHCSGFRRQPRKHKQPRGQVVSPSIDALNMGFPGGTYKLPGKRPGGIIEGRLPLLRIGRSTAEDVELGVVGR